MILLCWNCRGLERDSAVGELRWLVKQYRPSLLFLSETKMRDDSVRKFMWSLGFSGCLQLTAKEEVEVWFCFGLIPARYH